MNTYQDENYKYCIRSLLILAQKTENVHHEVTHLYSLQNIIDSADIDTLYPVNLETRLHQDISSQSFWISTIQLKFPIKFNSFYMDPILLFFVVVVDKDQKSTKLVTYDFPLISSNATSIGRQKTKNKCAPFNLQTLFILIFIFFHFIYKVWYFSFIIPHQLFY